MKTPASWTCPFCYRPTTITRSDTSTNSHDLRADCPGGILSLSTTFVVCPNSSCRKITLTAQLAIFSERGNGTIELESEEQPWALIPSSTAKQFPDYIPRAILDDYSEACAIRDLSPKAAATLARRCIQGIIRDFWEVKSDHLFTAIAAIEDKVDPLTWDAIDAVRKVGNIGAHMEKDINLIVDVDPNEAGLLIDLIEMLLEEWYIHREERKKKLASIVEVAEDKAEERKGSKPPAPPS